MKLPYSLKEKCRKRGGSETGKSFAVSQKTREVGSAKGNEGIMNRKGVQDRQT